MGGRGLTTSEQLLQNGHTADATDNTGVATPTSAPADGSASGLGCETASGETSGSGSAYGAIIPCAVYTVDSDVNFVGVEDTDSVSGGSNTAHRPGWLVKHNQVGNCTKACPNSILNSGCWTGGGYTDEATSIDSRWLAVEFGSNSFPSCNGNEGVDNASFAIDFKCVSSDPDANEPIKLTIKSKGSMDYAHSGEVNCTALALYVDGTLTPSTSNAPLAGGLITQCQWVFNADNAGLLEDETSHRFEIVAPGNSTQLGGTMVNLTSVKLHTGSDFTACEDQKACLKAFDCKDISGNSVACDNPLDAGPRMRGDNWLQYLCLDKFVNKDNTGTLYYDMASIVDYPIPGYSSGGSGETVETKLLQELNGTGSGGYGSGGYGSGGLSEAYPGTCQSSLPSYWTSDFDQKCLEWASCLDFNNKKANGEVKEDAHDVRGAIFNYLSASGCTCNGCPTGESSSTNSVTTPSGRRLLQNAASCNNPAVSDPESWDCNCHAILSTMCTDAGASASQMADCYKHYLCTLSDEKVCASWKATQTLASGTACTDASGTWSATGEEQLLQEKSTKTDDLLALMSDVAREDAQTEAKVGWDCG